MSDRGGGMEEVNRRLQERLTQQPEGWEGLVLAALAGDPVFYGVIISITVCVLAIVGILAAKVLIDQIEEEEQAEQRKLQQQRTDDDDESDSDMSSEPESKKQQ